MPGLAVHGQRRRRAIRGLAGLPGFQRQSGERGQRVPLEQPQAGLPGGGPATSAPAARTATAASSAGAAAACTGGLTGAESGVMRIVCDGPARIRVQAGSLVKQFTGGECAQAGDLWSATDGVITQAGVYKGPPVDVVSVNKDSAGGGTIQLMLGGKNYFVEGASLTLSDGGKAAHLHGTTTRLSDLPGTPVTVDVAC